MFRMQLIYRVFSSIQHLEEIMLLNDWLLCNMGRMQYRTLASSYPQISDYAVFGHATGKRQLYPSTWIFPSSHVFSPFPLQLNSPSSWSSLDFSYTPEIQDPGLKSLFSSPSP